MAGVSADDQLKKAIKHRDKLLTFAREREARTVVIDDQGDYYDNPDNVWLTEERTLVALERVVCFAMCYCRVLGC